MSHWPLSDAAATDALGRRLAYALTAAETGAVIALEGELGAGKTALARAVLTALGHSGPVVSPTYTMVEPYAVAGRQLFHLDLYRLGAPEELEYLGLRDLGGPADWWLVEWPARGAGYLPPLDLRLVLRYAQLGRSAEFEGYSAAGRSLAAALCDFCRAQS